MRRGRSRAHLTVALFPFLSVLVATTGVLALVVSGLATAGLARSDQVVTLTPGGSKAEPVYVECRAEGVRIHPAGTDVATADLAKDGGPWKSLLGRLAASAGRESLILLVRPDAIATFEAAYDTVDETKVAVGYEPIYAAGAVRFEAADGRRAR
jgi:hypothetical protein